MYTMVKSNKKKPTKKNVKKPDKKPDKKPEKSPEPLQTYNINLRTHERRAALQVDAHNWGTLKIMKQLNQVREAQQWNPRVHDLMTKDLEYLEKEFQREKR